jgi:anthranilate 1,2-dioxygenase small subunit
MSVTDPALRERIADLLLDCADAIDDDRLEEWPGLFTEHALYQIIPRQSFDAGMPVGVMLCEGRGMMQDRVNALRTANIFEPHAYRHLLGRPRIGVADGGWDVCTGFCVLRIGQDGETVVFATGRYVDRVVRDDAALRFQARRVVLDSHRIDILLVLPL